MRAAEGGVGDFTPTLPEREGRNSQRGANVEGVWVGEKAAIPDGGFCGAECRIARHARCQPGTALRIPDVGSERARRVSVR